MSEFHPHQASRTARAAHQEPETSRHTPQAEAGQFMQELVRRSEELGAANSLNEAIIENINHALVALDNSMRIVRCNQQFRDIFQLTPDVETGSLLTEAFPDERLEAIIKQSMTAEQSMQEMEFSFSASDGEERHFLLAISKFNAEGPGNRDWGTGNGEITPIPHSPFPNPQHGVLIIFDEVTEWRRRQFQVMEASRLVSIGEMAAGIAHEINNPLAAVMGFAQLALRRDIDDSVRRDLDKILAESKRASKIISNLQSFARRYKPSKAPVSIIEVVQKVLNFRAYELQVSNIEVVTRFDPRTPLIMGDQHQLDQAFLNIVINAEQMMSEANSGGTLTIEAKRVADNVGSGFSRDIGTGLKPPPTRVRVSFADDGPGIPRDVLPKIFDPFFTTKEVGKGTGLGLSICYGIIHEHGGSILVDSAPGKGAVFTIELPAMETPVVETMEERFDLSEPMPSLKILIVDDEPAVADFLSRVLSEFGHDVKAAGSADDVIEQADIGNHDVLILDVRMPGIGSEALFDRIKQLPKEKTPSVLLITGDTTNPTTRAFIDKTGNPVLTKPFTIEDLLSAIHRLVR